MALSIKSPEADRMARQLAELTGESTTAAILAALREKLLREQRKKQDKTQLLNDIRAIADHCASLPVFDTRSEDEILGYDRNGIPA
jgi:antitoxin VapB